MRRMLAAGVITLLTGALLVAAVEWLGHRIYPPPPGLDPMDPASLARYMESLPFGAKAMVVLAWLVAAVGGAFAGGFVAGRHHGTFAIVASVGLLLGVALNAMFIPHPAWMLVAGVVGIPLCAWIGSLAAKRRSSDGEEEGSA